MSAIPEAGGTLIRNAAVRSSRRGLFLDRDGTLIEDAHYLSDPAGVVVLPGVREALQRAQAAGWTLYLHTNQSGVGRGMFGLAEVHAVNARMEMLLDLGSPLFRALCIAPERPDEPPRYRKPSPRFILEMIAADNLDPRFCWMVGDSTSDLLAGSAAGIGAALVETGRAPVSEHSVPPQVPRCATLLEFVTRFLGT